MKYFTAKKRIGIYLKKMAFLGLFEIILSFVFFLLIRHLCNKNGLPTNWPVVGMLPDLLLNLDRINEWITDLLCSQSDGTFLFKGPWFSEMSQILLTIHPNNIHYIMSSNFANYPKGPEYRGIFDIFGTGIINTDGPTWKNQRKVAVALVSQRNFYNYILKTSRDKVKSCLIPSLDRAAETGMVIDVQDLFQRYTFDSTCKLITGFDPGSLSVNLPEVPFATALEDSMETIFYRHVVPHSVWKLQRWLGVGEEKKFVRAWKTFDQVIADYIKRRREELQGGECVSDKEGTDLLASYLAMEKDEILGLDFNDDRFLRDTILNLLLAGRDTTGSGLAWFFWNLSRHPCVEKKIRQEINSVSANQEPGSDIINKLVYLHAAICESLRLYPPVHWQHKRPTKPDILPSGHVVSPNTRIVFNLYAMGRMTAIWGKDCLEFKPERWITDNGGIKHEPAFKFPAFAAGPRSCIGKELGLTQMKTVAAAIIHKFHLEVVDGQNVTPSHSIILSMKNGLRVRVTAV